MTQRFLRSPVARNAGWLIGGRVARLVIDLTVGLITARYLGPARYGLISYAGAYTAFFTAICGLGISTVLVKELIDGTETEGQIMGTALGLQLLAGALSVLTIAGISAVADAGETTTRLVVALSSLRLLLQSFETFSYWFQAKLRARVTATVGLISYAVAAAYRVYLLVTGRSVVYFALASLIDAACSAILLLLLYRHQGGGALGLSHRYAASLLRRSYHFILPGLMVAVYGQTDRIMLKHMVGDTELGYYATAATLSTAWCFVLSAIIESASPSILSAFRTSRTDFLRRNRRLYAVVFYLSLSVSLLLTLCGGPVVRLLYGVEYLPSVAPLRVLTWCTVCSYLGVARNLWVVSLERQSYLKYVYMASAALNVLLNFLLIPFWGATGAALASLLAQLLSTLLLPLCIRPLRANALLMLRAIVFWRKE